MKTILTNANIVNENQIFEGHIVIENKLILKILKVNESIDVFKDQNTRIIDCKNQYILPGIIDDQVHFREPGLEQKADMGSESKAAVAGGITSFLEMPNTIPPTLTDELLEDKYRLAAKKSWANYGFYLGASNDNLDSVLSIDPKKTCGIKVFMGSSTGNMLVDNLEVLEKIFSKSKLLIAVHAEEESIIKANLSAAKEQYGEDIPISEHPYIRSEEACYTSSKKAVDLAKKYNSKLHLLHLSTAKELSLLDHHKPLMEKRITGEVCVHHLWFTEDDYAKYGTRIKWNPAIKKNSDRDALRMAVNINGLDVIATDHAPHLLSEKAQPYLKAPSGGPLVQHSLVAMLEMYHQKIFSLEKIVEKMCHAPAILFNIQNRGFIREGYAADLVVVDMKNSWTVEKDNILYKCAWSPFEGQTFNSKISCTFVNGILVYQNGVFPEQGSAERLNFN